MTLPGPHETTARLAHWAEGFRLDDAACRRISQRARFDPATDETGGKVVGTYAGTVKWEIPD